MSTYIDGIGASENIDSSGERISVAGMDISSLAVDGVFNWEHEQAKDEKGNPIQVKIPSQIVGKVLFAKKIFSEQDCDDDRQKHFWQKCQTPFVYVMGELFDDYKESAKDVAGMFRYDADRQGQQERNVMNFSIEGGKIEKQGIDILKSIARKVTITVLPCNKAAIAEMVPAETKKPKDDIDGLFKTENTIEIEMIKSEDMGKFLESIKKAADLKLVPPHNPNGTHIGKTKSGKDVHSHARVHEYQGFNNADHVDAANLHYNAIKAGSDPKTTQHHMNKMKLHFQAAASAERRENRLANASGNRNMFGGASSKVQASAHRPYAKIPNLNKTMTAGSANAAPGNLTGGAALAKQSLDNKLQKAVTGHEKGVNRPADGSTDKVNRGKSAVGMMTRAALNGKAPIKPGGKERQKEAAVRMHTKTLTDLRSMPKPNLTKSDAYWLQRAEQEFNSWDKKEQFVQFMSKRMPNLTKTEIQVLGAAVALKKTIERESILENLEKALKFDHPAGYKPSSSDATPKSSVPEHHKGKAPDVKGVHHTEVEHVETHYSGSHDSVYLKSGHRSEHQPKGKYKVGDKVTIKPHIQGTHILSHGHE